MSYSEAEVTGYVRLDADMHDCLLMRNNVGAFKAHDGRVVRYGLANESKNQNRQIKSSDLVGVRRVLITQDMVGKVIGQFVARECKHSDWKYGGSDEEEAQLAFITLMRSYGADADFATGKGTFDKTPRTRAKRLEPESRSVQILEAAYSIAEQHKQSKIVMADVARHAGVSMSAVRHYFPNREALLAALLDFSREKGNPVAMGRICAQYAEVANESVRSQYASA